jgi:hypothetical protein
LKEELSLTKKNNNNKIKMNKINLKSARDAFYVEEDMSFIFSHERYGQGEIKKIPCFLFYQ